MGQTDEVGHNGRAGEPGRVRLEDLIPIAVVIAAGCEPCAQRMVERALLRGTPAHLISRALGIVTALRAAECFGEAVGPAVIARMKKPLEVARMSLRQPGNSAKGPECCQEAGDGTPGPVTSAPSPPQEV
jgi:hypothetical protein